MKDAAIITLLSVLPRKGLSRAIGGVARKPLGDKLRLPFLQWYVGHYGVDLSECNGNLHDYPTVLSFFTRSLRDGCRPVAPEADAVVSPVDARVYSVGRAEDGRLPQGGRLDIVVRELLGGQPPWHDVDYAVLYLSPKDYHRVHCPREGSVSRLTYRPGRLWPVFPAAARNVRSLFARNERMIVQLDTDRGPLAVVMVGAFGVGRMRTTLVDDLVSNDGQVREERRFYPPLDIERGAELGRFDLGSTVILLAPGGKLDWHIKSGQAVRFGQQLASMKG